MRNLRRLVELGLPVAGAALVLSAIVFVPGRIPLQLGLALIGLILVRARTWSLAGPVLPSERRFIALRREVDGFILLVRRLNRATLALASEPTASNRAKLLEVRDEMIESVRRMEAAAGQAGGDVASADTSGAATESPPAPA